MERARKPILSDLAGGLYRSLSASMIKSEAKVRAIGGMQSLFFPQDVENFYKQLIIKDKKTRMKLPTMLITFDWIFSGKICRNDDAATAPLYTMKQIPPQERSFFYKQFSNTLFPKPTSQFQGEKRAPVPNFFGQIGLEGQHLIIQL